METDKSEIERHNEARELAGLAYGQAIVDSIKKIQQERNAKNRQDEIVALLLFWGEDAYLSAYRKIGFNGLLTSDGVQIDEQSKNFARGRIDGYFTYGGILSRNTGIVQAVDPDNEYLSETQRTKAILDMTQHDSEAFKSAEAQMVYGSVQMDRLKRSGFEFKRWQTQEDERVRFSHEQCQKQGKIHIGDIFVNGLRFPGDPDGAFKEIVNCRCLLFGSE